MPTRHYYSKKGGKFNKMKIVCEKDKITQAVFGVSRAVASKAAMPVLEGVYLKARDDHATLIGYDLAIAIRTRIDAKIEEGGGVVINSRIFCDFLRKADSDRISIECDEKNNVVMSAGNTRFSIVGMNISEYPEVPEVSLGKSVDLDYDLFRKMVEQTIYATAADDNNQMFKGINFEIYEDRIRLVGLDGKRLAIRNERVKNGGELTFITPAKTLTELIRLAGDDAESVNITLDKHHVSFCTGDFYVISRLIYGDYIKYENIIPNEKEISIEVGVRDFINAIDRVSLMMTDRVKSPIRLELKGEEMNFKCVSELGVATDSIRCENDSEKPLLIGFNNKFMTDALRATDCDRVKIDFISPIRPIKITPIDGDDFLFLVLPVQIAAEM